MNEYYDIGKEIKKASLIEKLCNLNPDFTYCKLDKWTIEDLEEAIKQHYEALNMGEYYD